MTREDVKKIFPDATDEQITAYLNAHNSEIQSAKKSVIGENDLVDLRNKAKLYDEYEDSKKTSEEKLAKALKEAEDLKSSNMKLLNKTKAAGVFIAAGMTEDDYSAFIDGIVSDNEETTLALANGVVSTLKSKVEATEKSVKAELLKHTPTPPAGNGESTGTIDTYRKLLEKAQTSGNISEAAYYTRVIAQEEAKQQI